MAASGRVGVLVSLNKVFTNIPRFNIEPRAHRCIHCSSVYNQSKSSENKDDATRGPPGSAIPTDTVKQTTKAEKISKAMKAYLERAKVMEAEERKYTAEYEVGKRHLANIMGVDYDLFTHQHVKEAIGYLMPSGLTEKKARPGLFLPEQITSSRKAPSFGIDGRPHHFLFYTGKPNYYETMYTITQKLEGLKQRELQINKKFGDELYVYDKKINLVGTEWMALKDLQRRTLESISEQEYARFILILTWLSEHPLAYTEEEFIKKFRRKVRMMDILTKKLKMYEDTDGRVYSIATAKRKDAMARVKVFINGTGIVDINGEDISYFKEISNREQILFPIDLIGKVGLIDIHAKVKNGGPSGQAGAIRLALSKAISAFMDEEVRRKMLFAGLLTNDPRRRERKKPGQKKARKKFTWRKR